MELLESLDPEDARAIVDPALKLMMDVVHRFDGYLVQSTGDGIFALFGAPVAHEDHPQRALYAALRIQDEMSRYAAKLREAGHTPIEARVGVNTGEVVVRSIRTGEGHTEYTPIGHSISLASRMQVLAPVGSIAATEQIRNLCEGYFQFRSLGPTRVKGVHEPVNVFEVTGLGPLRTKLQRAAMRGFTRFVGRDAEMAALDRAAEFAKSGHGQIVAVVGEAGVGKSRLFFEFNARHQAGWKQLEAFSVSHGKAASFMPVIELLKNYFGINEGDETRIRREKVAGRIAMLDRALEDTLPYVFGLLGLNVGDDPLAGMDANVRRRRTLDAIVRILIRESLAQPLIVVFEDLHWIDDETQALLNLLAESIGEAAILLALNYRPEYRHDWGTRASFTQIRLEPLKRESADEMLAAMLGNDPSIAPLRKLILDKSDATPFFIEEMVQTLFEEGVLTRNGVVRATRSITEIRLPATVNAVLAARVDRLAANEKELLQALAVIGREITLGLIKGVTRRSAEELERMLDVLQVGEFIYEQPSFSESAYIFKHALTQQVAYGSILVKRRKELHEATARQIEALFNSRLEDHYTALAHHYSSSGNSLKALEYLQLAAQQAIQRSANAEAIKHLTDAIQFLNTLPETPQRDLQELALQTMLGPALIATRGNGASEVGAVYNRALQLGRQSGEGTQLFPVLFGLRSFHLIRGELQQAFVLGQQLLSLAEDAHDSGLLVEAHLALGNSLFLFGKSVPALQHFERAVSLYDPKKHHVHAFIYGLDPGVFCLCRIASLLACMGHLDQAVTKLEEVTALAHRQAHPYSLALCLLTNYVTDCRGEWSAMQQQAEAAIALCSEHGFVSLLAQATMYRGYALARQGQTAEGIVLIRQGLDAQFATGAMLFRTRFLSILAEAYGIAERFEEGLASAAEGIAIIERTGERLEEARLHRLRGDLTLLRPEPRASSSSQAEAEACFRKAIEIARQQEVRAYELKAAISFGRLLSKQGRRAEAKQALAETYRWFSEGLDTTDLKAARTLLEELS